MFFKTVEADMLKVHIWLERLHKENLFMDSRY